MTPYGALDVRPDGWWPRTRTHARGGVRSYGHLTASLRMRPDYLIIGTKRGGTTSLARWLLEHPHVRPLFPARETRKGTYYFDVNYGRGDRWYRSHFPTEAAHRLREIRAGRRLLVGEATPYYLHHPHAPIRARQIVPGVKIIALLRNPVDRAHGHWAERSRQGVEWLDFDDAVAAEPGRLAGEEERMVAEPSYVSFAHQHFSYIDQGRYARGLSRWLGVFPSKQILVLRSEDLYGNPMRTFGEVLDFLDLDRFAPSVRTVWNRASNDPLGTGQRTRLAEMLEAAINDTEALLDRAMGWS